jgi:hypothetical protein
MTATDRDTVRAAAHQVTTGSTAVPMPPAKPAIVESTPHANDNELEMSYVIRIIGRTPLPPERQEQKARAKDKARG